MFGTPARTARNVILFVGDGMSVTDRTAARILSKGLVEGRYGGELAMDDMPAMALISTSGTDSVVTDSANSMSAYTTGHKTCVNAMVSIARSPRARSITRRSRPSANWSSARPAWRSAWSPIRRSKTRRRPAWSPYTRRRSDYNDIVKMFYDVKPDIVMGGGSPNFLPKAVPGSKVDRRGELRREVQGRRLCLRVDRDRDARRLRGRTRQGARPLQHRQCRRRLRPQVQEGHDGPVPDQPDLAEQTRLAIELLAQRQGLLPDGRIGPHRQVQALARLERGVYDTIMLDNAVKIAKDFAAKNNDTLIIVVPDHAHMVGIIGTYDDSLPADTLREARRLRKRSSRSTSPMPTAIRKRSTCRCASPTASAPTRTIASTPSRISTPNSCCRGRAEKGTFRCQRQQHQAGEVWVTGNLPATANSGVHAADDVLLTALGPGAEAFRGRLDNTRVFRTIVTALGLGRE